MAGREILAESGEVQETSLPDFVNVSEVQVNKFYDLWLTWRMTGKRHLIRDLLNEPEEAQEVVLEIENHYQQLLSVIRAERGRNDATGDR